MTNQKLVRAKGVTKEFGGGKRADRITVLHEISMEVSAGEMVAIVGPSGSGKSTLLFCLSGLEKTTNGSVTLFDAELGQISGEKLALLRQERVGFIFQAYNLIPCSS